MTLEELLQNVCDNESFVQFVRAMADEREASQEDERENSAEYCVDGALGWKNADISSFLYAGLEYFEERPFHKPENSPSWKMLADFLYFGKIYE
jgi:hypothetical protein